MVPCIAYDIIAEIKIILDSRLTEYIKNHLYMFNVFNQLSLHNYNNEITVGFPVKCMKNAYHKSMICMVFTTKL